jgi:hypothetical protein
MIKMENNINWDVGRNELCPCGSGRKYKKCCLRKVEQERSYNLAIDRVIDKVLSFFAGEEETYLSEVNNYLGCYAQVFEMQVFNMPDELEFLAYFNLIFDCKLEGNKTFLELFKEEQGHDLSKRGQQVLDVLIGTRLKVYQVNDQRGSRYELENLFQPEGSFVIDREEEEFLQGDILVGRIVQIGEYAQLVGPYNVVSFDYKDVIKAELNGMWAELKTENDSSNWEEFSRLASAQIWDLFFWLMEEPMDIFPIIYEVSYKVQFPQVVKERLLELDNIIKEEQVEQQSLVWLAEESALNFDAVKGHFIIEEDNLVYITPREDQLEPGKNLLESELSFLIEYDEECIIDPESGEVIEWITRGQEISEAIVEAFISSPIEGEEDIEGQTPQELVKDEVGRAKLESYLDRLELLMKFLSDDDPNTFTLDEVQAIKKRLGYEVKEESLLEDGVERLLVEKMKNCDGQEEELVNAIILWRDYQNETDSWTGSNSSWAAALEYLIGRISFSIWQPTQAELGESYDVSVNKISEKHQTIAETLGIEVNDSQWVF